MGREIVYSETSGGVFEPVPTRAQKRQAKRAREERAKKVNARVEQATAVLMVIFLGLGFATYMFGNIVAFGGGFGPGSVWAKLMAWLA